MIQILSIIAGVLGKPMLLRWHYPCVSRRIFPLKPRRLIANTMPPAAGVRRWHWNCFLLGIQKSRVRNDRQPDEEWLYEKRTIAQFAWPGAVVDGVSGTDR